MVDENKREAFWSLIAIASNDECWNVTFNLSSAQWHLRHLKLGHIPHRIAYVLTYGEIGKKDKVKQLCGNPRCCNFRHLKIDNEIDVRFWSHVDKSPGHGRDGNCWVWTSTIDRKGYGFFKVSSKRGNVLAHRFSYQLVYGDIPSTTFVLHKCDNPACVRPDHLFAGNQKDNIRDAVKKQRFEHGKANLRPELVQLPGSLNPAAKLTEDDVITIRKMLDMGVTLSGIAKTFQVSRHTIALIRDRKTWKHI